METNKEISALLHLIDDPDQEVFDAVSQKIVDYGKPIIPNLEHLWETTPRRANAGTHWIADPSSPLSRSHRRFSPMEFIRTSWPDAGRPCWPASFNIPICQTLQLSRKSKKIRRNIWLELNNYLTPLEQINIVTSILYSYYGLKGNETNYKEPNEFLLHKTLEAKRGNQISNGILYLMLCELVGHSSSRQSAFPRQFIVAYFKPGYSEENLPNPFHKIEFFIDPTSGQVFTHQDVDKLFQTGIAFHLSATYFKPQSNKKVIHQLLEEFSKCFESDKDVHKKTSCLNAL